MSNIFSSSIGKKILMSLTGLFLMVFLLVHLIINLMLLVGPEAYNKAAHFMATNPAIKVMEPLLALGFIIHILLATVLTLKNRQTRPVRYAVTTQSASSTWASRNMYVLGFTLFVFLVIHMLNFFIKMKFTGDDLLHHVMVDGVEMENAYALVSTIFINYWYIDVLYLIGFISLGFHLYHGFWSAFQSIGLSNNIWKKRLVIIGRLYLIALTVGYSIIPLYFLFLNN